MVAVYRLYINMTPRQIEVLSLLARREQWFIKEIAAVYGISAAAATKTIDRLERKGVVIRASGSVDKRCVAVHITNWGKNVLQKIQHAPP